MVAIPVKGSAPTERSARALAFKASKVNWMAPNPIFTIHIEKPEVALAKTMAEMRSWLDTHSVEAIGFKIQKTLTLPNVVFDLQFRNEDDAVLFEQAFS